MTKTQDRRVLRTRAMLHEAMISLMLEKGYEAITTKDIVDRANVGRSTFYSHYTGKDDLFRSGFEGLRAHLVAQQKPEQGADSESHQRRFGFSLAMFEHAHANRDLYLALVGERGGALFMHWTRQMIADLVREDLRPMAERSFPDPNEQEAAVQHVAGGYVALLTWWLDRNVSMSPAQMDAIFNRLTWLDEATAEAGVSPV